MLFIEQSKHCYLKLGKAVCTKLDIYVFITGLIPLIMVDY